MNSSALAARLTVFGATLWLAGCVALRPVPEPALALADTGLDTVAAYAAQSAREAFLAETRGDWRLRGRVAFTNGNDAVTLQVDWTQRGEAFDICLVAPISARQWRLSGRPGQAELHGLDAGPRHAVDAESLLLEATGWVLPMRHFPYWVRGARGNGAAVALSVDAHGRPLTFRQDGWSLRFLDWWPGEPTLPRRVFAEREGASVRLIVTEWQTFDPVHEIGRGSP